MAPPCRGRPLATVGALRYTCARRHTLCGRSAALPGRLTAHGGGAPIASHRTLSRLSFATLRGADQVAYAPGGELLAVSAVPATIWLCPITSGDCRELRGHGTRIHAMAFTPDGRALVTANGDHTLRVWSVATGESRVLRGHGAPVFDVALSPDGKLMASGSADNTIRVWSVDPPPDPKAMPELLKRATSYVIAAEPSAIE